MTSQPRDLQRLTLELESPDLKIRLQAVIALMAYDTATAVPLLCSRGKDSEYLVRQAVAAGLGRKRSPQAFQALQKLLQDGEPQVRAEAVLALGRFGTQATIILLEQFQRDEHPLARSAVLDALIPLLTPIERFKLFTSALETTDIALQAQATLGFSQFANTQMQTAALDHLQPLTDSPHGVIRSALARSLQNFDHHRARESLAQLHDDPDHRVVAALLEGLV